MFQKEPQPRTIFVKIVLGCFGFLTIFAWLIVWELSSSNYLEVVFFDVGQGDSIFVETPQRYQILIDGGPDLSVLEKLAKEMPFYDRTLDLVILTHPERDHLFGLLEVLKRYKIKNILWTGVARDTAEWKEWERLIKEEGAEIIIAQAGQKIILSEKIYLAILYPLENLEGQEFKYYNDTSIVAKLIFGDAVFLFTGDISKKVEKGLLEGAKLPAGSLAPSRELSGELSSSVLKVAHHGSKTSTHLEFLQTVSPQIAVISVGENKYGHPSPEVLANLEKFGIQVLITKELGDIKLISDGEKIYEKY